VSEFLTDSTGLDLHEPMSRFTGNALLAWEGLRSGVALDSTENESVFEGMFVSTADGTNLDAWGADYDLDRSSGESDSDYRTRILAILQAQEAVGTRAAILAAHLVDASAPAPGLTVFSARLGGGGVVLAPEGVVHPLSPGALFGGALYLYPGLDTTTIDSLMARLETVTFVRDTLQLAEVDGTGITPVTIDGTATASSFRGAGYEPALAIDGTLGDATGSNSFYWDATDAPNSTTPPFWSVTLTGSGYADLLMIAQEPRADVNRLKRIRVTVSPPADCALDLGYSFEVELYDPGLGNYERHFFPLPRPTLVGELKIEVLSAWPNGLTYHTLAEVELYPPSAWTRIWKRRFSLGK